MDRQGSDDAESSMSIDLSNQEFKNKEDFLRDDVDNDPNKKVDLDDKPLKAKSYETEQMVDSSDEDLDQKVQTKAKKVSNIVSKLNVSDCSQTLARILKNPDRYGSKRNRDRGKLDARKLGKLCTNTPNIFHQPWKQAGTKTAVSLLIDTSSSMKSRKIGRHLINNSQESINLALVLGNALHKVQVKYSVGCFPSANFSNSPLFCATGKSSYDKDYYILKDHDQHWMKSKHFVAYQHGKSDGGTPTHDAMMSEGLRLAKRSEDRKVMIIVTDGTPNSVEKCRQAKEIVSKWGIEVIGMVLTHYKLYSDVDPSWKRAEDQFIKSFDGCFDHYIVESSAKTMITNGLKELNKILK